MAVAVITGVMPGNVRIKGIRVYSLYGLIIALSVITGIIQGNVRLKA